MLYGDRRSSTGYFHAQGTGIRPLTCGNNFPYKEDVIGSNPVAPTKIHAQRSGNMENRKVLAEVGAAGERQDRPHCTCEVGMGSYPGDHHEKGCQLNPVEPVLINSTHPVGRRSVPGIHHADDCPMRYGLVTTGCFCGREGEREVTS